MAERSFMWAGTSVGDAALASPYGAPYSDDTFTDMYAAFLNTDRRNAGILPSFGTTYATCFDAVSDGGSGLTIQPGQAMVDGKLYQLDTTKSYSFSSNGTWQVVLQKVFSTQTVRMLFRLGSTVTQTDQITWEVELWRFTYTAGFAPTMTDKRKYLSSPGGGGRVQLGNALCGWDNNGAFSNTVTINLPSYTYGPAFMGYEIIFSDCATDESGVGVYESPMGFTLNGDATAGRYRWAGQSINTAGTTRVENNAATAKAMLCGYIGCAGTGGLEYYRRGSGKITIYQPKGVGNNLFHHILVENTVMMPETDHSWRTTLAGAWEGANQQLTSITFGEYYVPTLGIIPDLRWGRWSVFGLLF